MEDPRQQKWWNLYVDNACMDTEPIKHYDSFIMKLKSE